MSRASFLRGSQRRRPLRRGSWTGALAIAVSVALAACVGIPTEGSVVAGDLVTEDESFPFAVLPSGPQEDSTQQEILTDFMQAATSPEGLYEIARQFLTPAAADSWKPKASVLIREGGGSMVSTDEQTVEYSVSTQASVDALGLYKEDRDPATQRLVFTFAQVDGQWRISGLPDGTVVSRDNFEAAFDAHALYFFDPSYRFLIPDVRWFPSRSNVPNSIVLALLEGQASWLQQGATLTAFPQGTELETPVEVSSGLATVDLSNEVTEMNNLDKARMQQQLESSLGTVSVNTVLVTVRNVPLTISDAGASNATITPPTDSDPLVRNGDTFGFATLDTFASISGISNKVIEVDASAATLARGQTSAAVLGTDGAYLITASDPPLLVDSRANLIAPSIDSWRYVWSVPSTPAAPLFATAADGVVHEVVSALPSDASIVSMDLSRDGARVVLYLTTDSGPRLMVAAVLRRDGVPTGLGELVDLPVQTDVPIDASWVDDRSVATLAVSEGHEVVNMYPLGGPGENLGRADGGQEIVGGNGSEQLRVLTGDGSVLQRRASGWQSTGLTADFLATQQ